MEKKWKSCAEWEPSVYTGVDGKHVTTDTHYGKDAADGVCNLLERDGLGGDRVNFPIKTWVEEIKG